MRNVVLATVLALAFMLPTAASATEVPPLPPALICTKYRATIVCWLWESPATVRWYTPWHSGVSTAYWPT